MKRLPEISLKEVRSVYDGPEADLWELIMGEQIHIGGIASSMDLAEKAGIKAGMKGVDFCCCTGAGMRFLVRFRGVSAMTGVDATRRMLERGRQRCADAGLSSAIRFIEADVCASGLPDASSDFIWGEDAWCYVADKEKLIQEAARIVKPDGVIAFTDWIEGDTGLTDAEAERFMTFMKFPSLPIRQEYVRFLKDQGCAIIHATDTGRFAPYVDLYLNMLNMQLGYDALRIIGFDNDLLKALGEEMVFMQQLAHAGKIAQGLFVARNSLK